MTLLLDTHLLLWAAGEPDRLSADARRMIADPATTVAFSAASIWEVSIKAALGRDDFVVDARTLRRDLLEHGYVELAISGAHAAATPDLPPIHNDPFDRILVAQARVEGFTLLTRDRQLGAYGSPVVLV